MTNGAVLIGAAGAGAAAASAIKAMGPIVCVEPETFLTILQQIENPLVIHSPSSFLVSHKYMTSYKGFVFFAKSKEALLIPASVEIVTTKKIWIPQV